MYTKLKTYKWLLIKSSSLEKLLYLPALIFFITACTDFVTVELPKQHIANEAVFNDPATAEAALKGIYSQMRSGLLGGGSSGLNYRLGLYTDELELNAQSESLEVFQNHTLLSTNGTIEGWWDSAYNQIYAANSVIEGVENSESLTSGDRDQFKGEALFIRAYLHVVLTELFGDIPYITTTDYIENTTVARMPRDLVYEHIIADLTLAASLMSDSDISSAGNPHIRPYATVAEAALARAYLYTEDWVMAEAAADTVIAEFGALEPDLSRVFLKDATSTIWQFKSDPDGANTDEGAFFIFTGTPSGATLTDSLFFAFETGTIFQPGDNRKSQWIKTVTVGTKTWRHAYKYKERNNTGSSVEYSIQLRLAEQYLIRAEARAQLGNIPGAKTDLNAIRNRAGLGNTTAATLNELLDAILQERRVELFTEKGHRWFDLKRMGKAKAVLEPIKPGWKDTDVLFPIPNAELLLNPNLLPQNDGY
jgi:hypothetical protein